MLGDELCRPEGDFAGVVIEHRVRGVVVGGVRGLQMTIPAIHVAAITSVYTCTHSPL